MAGTGWEAFPEGWEGQARSGGPPGGPARVRRLYRGTEGFGRVSRVWEALPEGQEGSGDLLDGRGNWEFPNEGDSQFGESILEGGWGWKALLEGRGDQEFPRWARRGQQVVPEGRKGSGRMGGVRRPCQRARVWREAYPGGHEGFEEVVRPSRRDRKGWQAHLEGQEGLEGYPREQERVERS